MFINLRLVIKIKNKEETSNLISIIIIYVLYEKDIIFNCCHVGIDADGNILRR